MRTMAIQTSQVEAACDVCGRTLLRGERSEVYLDSGVRRSVCELCRSRAVAEGWIREGTLPSYDGADTVSDRRRSLIGRLLRRREQPSAAGSRGPRGTGARNRRLLGHREAPPEPPSSPEPLQERADAPPSLEPHRGRRLRRRREFLPDPPEDPRAASSEHDTALAPLRSRAREAFREPRHVRAVPTSPEHKLSSAIELFNSSEHPRTIAGVARSLGLPAVSIHPSQVRPSIVNFVVSWELCWYRYEVDLADEEPAVRVADQGSELHELAPQEREPNALSDENGALLLGD